MAADQLSHLLDQIAVRGVVSGGFAVRGRWAGRSQLDEDFKFFAVLRGSVRLTTDAAEEAIVLEAGDVGLLNGRAWFRLEGGVGDGPVRDLPRPESGALLQYDADARDQDVVLGGRIDLDRSAERMLRDALPPVARIRSGDDPSAPLRRGMELLFDEVRSERIGSEFAVRQHAQLLILEVLRASVGRSDLPPGWLKAAADARLRPALELMHAEPERPWRLDQLAQAAAMSRTSFAERFRAVAGTPPLTYLNDWRMLLAQRSLRDSEQRVGALARQLGYTSESAFSTAFKRLVGESPLRYRARLRNETARATA